MNDANKKIECNTDQTFFHMTFFESFTYVCIRTEVGGSRMSVAKVIIEKSRGEVSPMGQDTIENVSQPIKSFEVLLFDTSKSATLIRY